jgi:hypothetical protein
MSVRHTATASRHGRFLSQSACLALGGAVVALPGVASAQQAVTQPLVLRGQPAPGTADGVNFGLFFHYPTANGAGGSAFLNTLTGAGVTEMNNAATFVRRPDGTTVLVAREGSPAPSLGPGINFREPWDTPVLSDAGHIAFASRIGGTGVVFGSNDRVIFAGPPDALVPVARQQSQAAGLPAGTIYVHLDPWVLMNDAGGILYRSTVAGPQPSPNLREALFFGPPASITAVVRTGDAAHGMPAGVTYAPSFDMLGVNDDGHIAYRANLAGASISRNLNDSALYAGPAGAPTLVARRGDSPPGVSDPGARYGRFDNFILNDAGVVAYGVRLEVVDSTTDEAVYAGPAAAPRLIAREGGAVPHAAPGMVYRQFGQPTTNDVGGIAFSGYTGEGFAGALHPALFTGTLDDVRPVLMAGAPAAGAPHLRYGGFSHVAPALNNAGQIAFDATLITAENNMRGRGLFLWDPVLGDMLIAREGGMFDVGGGTLRRVRGYDDIGFARGTGNDSPSGVGDDGRFVFRLIFDDGSSGIFSATVPEPGTPGMMAAGAALLLRRRRR